jgi:translation initiation factor IF-3
MPIKRIAGILNVSEQLVSQSIAKFLQSGRIKISEQGIISIINWSKYQYSDYDRQKEWRQKKSQQG